MKLLRWLLGSKKAKTTESVDAETLQPDEDNVIRVPFSKVKPLGLPEGSTIITEPRIPASCIIGNLVFEKKYKEAIDLGLKLLEKTPTDSGVLIHVMDAYFKGRILAPEYLDKSTYYAKQAMLYGHHTGYAELRLARNLERTKCFHQSLQLYKLILDTEGFHFSPHGVGFSIDFEKRRSNALKNLSKATDKETDVLFTPTEIAQILQSVKDNDTREEQQREKEIERERTFEESRKARTEKLRELYKELLNTHKKLDGNPS